MIVTPVQAANLIQNGSFETATVSPNPGNFITLNAGSTVITGWTVSLGSIDYMGTLWQASNGSRSLDLEGLFGSGAIQQTFNTTIGATYRVTFDLAGNPAGGSAIKQMRVRTGGSSADFSFDTTGKSFSNMGWVSKSWDFTANSTTTTLEFVGLTNSIAGPALDNVSVIAVPEPSSMLGLLSLGVLGISSALKRQS